MCEKDKVSEKEIERKSERHDISTESNAIWFVSVRNLKRHSNHLPVLLIRARYMSPAGVMVNGGM